MEPVIVVSVAMIWIVVAILLILTSFGYGLKSRGFAADHPAIFALPMSGIGIGEYRAKKGDHPIVDEDLDRKSKIFMYAAYVAIVLLIVFIVAALFI